MMIPGEVDNRGVMGGCCGVTTVVAASPLLANVGPLLFQVQIETEVLGKEGSSPPDANTVQLGGFHTL